MQHDDILLRPLLQVVEVMAKKLRAKDETVLHELDAALASGTGLTLAAARRMSPDTLVAVFDPRDVLGLARLEAVVLALEAEGTPVGRALVAGVRARAPGLKRLG